MKSSKRMAEEIFQEISVIETKKKKRRKNVLRCALCAFIALIFLPGAVYFTTGEEFKNHVPLSFDWTFPAFEKDKDNKDSTEDETENGYQQFGIFGQRVYKKCQ